MNLDIAKNSIDTRPVRNIGLFVKLIVKFESINGITVIKEFKL